MATPNPLEPVKGAGTTLWVYNGKGDAYANPLSDDDWQRLAKVKDLTPGEMTAEPYDDNYLDDEDADWTATGQGQKSAGDTSFTLAWKPGEEGQNTRCEDDMATPNPLEPVKGAGTTLWVYNGKGDAYANPLSDDDWQRLAKVKDLTPGEMTAEPYDDNYLDDEDADWTATGQGQKSAGDTSFTLAWKPGEEGQKGLIGWFESGDVRAYKIRFPNGTVDVFRGWVSSIGKAVTAKEVITRTVKVTNVGKPSVAEERSKITPVTAIKVTPTSGTVAKGKTTTLTVSFEPESATDKTFRAVSADPSKATISVKDMTITVNGVATGKVQIPVVSGNGQFAAVAEVTVTEAGAAG